MYICAAHRFLVSVHQDAFCYILSMGGSPILTTCTYNNNHGGFRLSLLHALFFVPLGHLLCAFSLSIPIRVIPDLRCRSYLPTPTPRL